jgi:hypothetical protein
LKEIRKKTKSDSTTEMMPEETSDCETIEKNLSVIDINENPSLKDIKDSVHSAFGDSSPDLNKLKKRKKIVKVIKTLRTTTEGKTICYCRVFLYVLINAYDLKYY